MNKVVKSAALLLAALSLTACFGGQSKTDKDGNTVAVSNGVEVTIKEGAYIMPRDEDSDSNYLALKVSVKNTSGKKLSVSTSDFSLYDSEDEKIDALSVYDSDDKFKTFGYEQVSKGKTVTGYVVYEVDKDAKYELHYVPMEYDAKKKEKDIELKVDASKYQDNKDKVKGLAEDYIKQVFLTAGSSTDGEKVSFQGGQVEVSSLADKKSDKKSEKADGDKFEIGNDIEKDRKDFHKAFTTALNDDFYSYTPSNDELNGFVDKYVAANAKRAKIDYEVESYLPDSMTLKIKADVIDLGMFSVSNYRSAYYDTNRDKHGSLSDTYKAGEKDYLDNAQKVLEAADLSSSSYNDYTIKLTRKGNKWTVDTSDYSYESLQRVFRGGIY